MFKRLIVFLIYLYPILHFAQDYSALWTGHFSYYNIKKVIKGNNKIYGVADNAIFSFNTQTKELNELTTINGLSGENISTIYYSEDYELMVVGYENGLIEIAFDNDDKILTLVDIVDKATIPPTSKRINHFYAYGNLLYISTNYGISVFNLERLEFGDTYLIGDNGSQIVVNQTAVFENYIYAASVDGIKKALVTNPNLIDYANWQTIITGNFLNIQASTNKLFTINVNRTLYEVINDTINQLFTYQDTPLDFQIIEDNLVVTTSKNVFIYDINQNLLSQADINLAFSTNYTSASIDSESIFIGTTDFGILKTELLNPLTFTEVHPDGPLLNIPFSLEAEPDGLWVTFGDYDVFYNPYPLDDRGISHLSNNSWFNIPYSDVFSAKSLNAISINPNNNNQVFISSFFSGLLEVNNNIPTALYNQTNSALESLVLSNDPNYIDIRVGATSFDNNGLLWTTTGLVERQVKSYNPSNNQWSSYSLNKVIPNAFDNNGFRDIIIDNNQTKWMSAGYSYGVLGFNENNGNPLVKAIYKEEDNMPFTFVTALDIDKRNQLWIGTSNGLRVLYNTSNFFDSEDVSVDEIIIIEDGIAKELLFQQFISDIKVDGSNNKWIGTSDSGLFYLSPDGQNTIYHFTTDNSPLPSNTINAISIDETKGIVYIGTSRGLVSFRSGASSPFETLESAYAYPNPVRPNFNIVDDKVKIKDISENVNIKITDVEGNLVAEAQSNTNKRYNGYNLEIDGGTAYWNGKNLANNVVASGVYLVMLSDLDTFETKVLKIMVIR